MWTVFASFMWLQYKILFCCECGLMYQFWKSLLRIFTIDPSVPFLHKTRRKYFAFYADTCFASFGDRVKHWITLNDSKQQSWSWHWDFCTWKTWTTHRRKVIWLRTTWPMQQLFPYTEASQLIQAFYLLDKLLCICIIHSSSFHLYRVLHSFVLSKVFSNWLWYSKQC